MSWGPFGSKVAVVSSSDGRAHPFAVDRSIPTSTPSPSPTRASFGNPADSPDEWSELHAALST